MIQANSDEKVIGIPRAMSFYNNYPFYYGFFNYLGIKIVLSDITTKQTMSAGAGLVVTETCLPIKVYIGHILNLLSKGVDKIFVPSLQSIDHKIYNCSKIRGLPDLVRNVVKQPFTMIEATLDKSEKHHGLYDFLAEAVKPFNITDKELIKKASKAGWRCYNNFHVMSKSGMPYSKALSYALQGKVVISAKTKEYPIAVALVGHGYNIYDERVCMKIFDKLEKMDVKVCTTLQLSEEQLGEGITSLGNDKYWANEDEMTGTAGHFLKDNKIDGVITITAFGCGPDSLMIEDIKRKAKNFQKPLLNLSIDEHTGEAGFVTRLEAFCDMLFRNKRVKLSTQLDGEIQENTKTLSEITNVMSLGK